MKRKNKVQRENRSDISFRQQLAQLPEVMKQRFVKQVLAAFLIVGLTVLFMIYFKSWQFCIGVLLALYIAYLAMDLVWSYHKKTIECRRMICVKATILPGGERVFLIMKDLNPQEENQSTKQFYVSASKKQTCLFTPQTIIDMYFRPKNALEVIAWEIVGNNGES